MASINVSIGRSLSEPVDEAVISLEDVRAANNLKIRYDYERDGWQVFMDRHVGWRELGPDTYDDMRIDVEVAFISAWLPGDEISFIASAADMSYVESQ